MSAAEPSRSCARTPIRRACARLRSVELTEFVLSQLPPASARVLEVGCGKGEVARALAAKGYDIVAIDPEAPDGPIFRRTTIEDFQDPGSFDAVVASLALHHVEDLRGGLDKRPAMSPGRPTPGPPPRRGPRRRPRQARRNAPRPADPQRACGGPTRADDV